MVSGNQQVPNLLINEYCRVYNPKSVAENYSFALVDPTKDTPLELMELVNNSNILKLAQQIKLKPKAKTNREQSRSLIRRQLDGIEDSDTKEEIKEFSEI